MTLRNTVTAVIAMAVAGIPSSAGAADVLGQGAGVAAPPYVAAPSPPARLPYYESAE